MIPARQLAMAIYCPAEFFSRRIRTLFRKNPAIQEAISKGDEIAPTPCFARASIPG